MSVAQPPVRRPRRGSRGWGELNRRRRLREANGRNKQGRQSGAAYEGRSEHIYSPKIDWLMPMAVPAAEATTPSGFMPAAASAVPAAEAAAVPASETGPPASLVPVPAPGWSPGEPPGPPTVEPDRRPDEPRPATAERTDGCSRPQCRASGYVATTPPTGSDGREGQDGRTDKQREGGRREDDERRRRRNNDGRRRQDHDRRWQRGAEQRADRRR
jgi:hypothetical protein